MDALALALAVLLQPDPPPPALAERHAAIAVELADPALLLAITHSESRHLPGAVSRLECRGDACRRRASRVSRRWPAPHWRGPYCCGITQVAVRTWRACRALDSDDRAALERAAAKLADWARARPCAARRGTGPRTRCALAGYGAGWAGAVRGSSRYARRVLARRARLESMARAIRLVMR